MVTLGPSDDGGCYLVGATVAPGAVPDVFAGVRWNTPYTLDDLLRGCVRAGRTVKRLDSWNGVINPSDLTQLADRLRYAPDAAPNTAAALRNLRLL
jgi:glycosyltransferase A (GT-A) superfamily protein (DUF2064 family)